MIHHCRGTIDGKHPWQMALCARVQPRQDPGGTVRMNGIGERERWETSLDRAKSASETEKERERERE